MLVFSYLLSSCSGADPPVADHRVYSSVPISESRQADADRLHESRLLTTAITHAHPVVRPFSAALTEPRAVRIEWVDDGLDDMRFIVRVSEQGDESPTLRIRRWMDVTVTGLQPDRYMEFLLVREAARWSMWRRSGTTDERALFHDKAPSTCTDVQSLRTWGVWIVEYKVLSNACRYANAQGMHDFRGGPLCLKVDDPLAFSPFVLSTLTPLTSDPACVSAWSEIAKTDINDWE